MRENLEEMSDELPPISLREKLPGEQLMYFIH